MGYQSKKSIAAKRATSKRRKGPRAVSLAPLLSADVSRGVERAAKEFRKHLTNEGIDAIVIADLSAILDSLRCDYDRRVANKDSMAIFTLDRKKDLLLMRHHIKSLEVVLRYYGGGPEL